MEIRQATAEDAGKLSSIIVSSWQSAYQQLIDNVYLTRLPKESWVATLRPWLESGRMYGLMAMEAEKAVGCVIYGRGRDESHADWGEIVALYLLPEAIGKGIGHALLNHALEELHADGYVRVYLWSIDGNLQAEEFYRRHGFTPDGAQVAYRLGSSEVRDIRMIRASLV